MSILIYNFLKKEQREERSENSRECNYCNSKNIVFDAESCERICSDCGLVLAEHLDPADQPNNNLNRSDSHHGVYSSLVYHDQGLPTLIPYSNIDAHGVALNSEQRSKMNTIRRWNLVSNSNRTYHRNLKNALAILMRIKDKLSLSDPSVEKSAYYYRKAIDLKLMKGRSVVGFVVASVYISCREANIPRKIEEIAEAANTDGVFAGKCYRLLLRRLKIRLPSIDSASHLSRIASNAGISERTVRKAAEMMSIIKENPISSGKDPNALAVAVLYGACLEQGENVSQGQVAIAGKVSVVTLRKRFADVRQVLPQVPNGPNAVR